MSIGTRIAEARKKANFTQQQLAEKLNVSFQAISSWERDEFLPDTSNLINLAKTLNVSVSNLVENYNKPAFKTCETIFNVEKMYNYVSSAASNFEFKNTLEALPFIKEVYKREYIKGIEETPYIYHPLSMACHCLAMDINDDQIIAACLLSEVIEKNVAKLNNFPFTKDIVELVSLLTKSGNQIDKYYKNISKNPKACLVKCIGRCNELTTMAYSLSRENIADMVLDTEKNILPLIKILDKKAEYNDAAWLLKYQICSSLDLTKRMM